MACNPGVPRATRSADRTVWHGLIIALVLGWTAGCAGPTLRKSPDAPAPAAAAEPVLVSLARSGGSYFEPAGSAQDQRLAGELAALFTAVPEIRRAYLARVSTAGEPQGVLTVCMAADGRVADEVVRRIGRVYADTHGTDGVLDVLELDPGIEHALAGSVTPFYGTPLAR